MSDPTHREPPSGDYYSQTPEARASATRQIPKPASSATQQSKTSATKRNSTATPISAKPRPLLLPGSAIYSTLHAGLSLYMLSLCASTLASPQPSFRASSGYLILALFEMLTTGLSLSNMHAILTMRCTHGQLMDRYLLMFAGVVPTFQALLTALHPPFLATQKNWPAIAAFAMGSGVSMCSFSPAHSLVQWTTSSICFTFLDCYGRAHKQQECPTSIWGLPACLLTQGLVIGATGLAAWLTAHILVTKRSTSLRSQAESITSQGAGSRDASGPLPGQLQQEGHSDGSGSRKDREEEADARSSASLTPAPRTPLPFESWGLKLPPAAVRACQALERALRRLADAVDEGMLVRVVCLPIIVYSLAFCFLARLQFKGLSYCSMSPDTFVIYVIAWFMAGRHSCNFDIGPLLMHIQSSLSASLAQASYQPSLTELVDRVRQQVAAGAAEDEAASGRVHQITVTELLGEGTFGKVYKGEWRGTSVAVKRMVLPVSSKWERRGRMAIMEAAISGALVHPNIVQTYTYTVQSVHGGSTGPSEVHVGDTLEHVPTGLWHEGSPDPAAGREEEAQASTSGVDGGLEVQLVLEYMDCGTLRDVLDQGCFLMPSPSGGAPSVNYHAVLETAADVAKGMMHLHSLNVVHCDLKARNVLLRSCASDPRSFTAKVGDFGLSLKLDSSQTSVNNCFHGTPTHMAPEVHTQGRQSKAADVYSFGIMLWELYTGRRPFLGVNRELLGHKVAERCNRPLFPPSAPNAFTELAARCWDPKPEARPSFEEVTCCLTELLSAGGGEMAPVPVTVLGSRVGRQALLSRSYPSIQPLLLRTALAARAAAPRDAGNAGELGVGGSPAGGVPEASTPLERAAGGGWHLPLEPAAGMSGVNVDWDGAGMSGVLVRTAVSESENRTSAALPLPPALLLHAASGFEQRPAADLLLPAYLVTAAASGSEHRPAVQLPATYLASVSNPGNYAESPAFVSRWHNNVHSGSDYGPSSELEAAAEGGLGLGRALGLVSAEKSGLELLPGVMLLADASSQH